MKMNFRIIPVRHCSFTILPNFENVEINGGSFTCYMSLACCKYLAYVTIYICTCFDKIIHNFNALCLL